MEQGAEENGPGAPSAGDSLLLGVDVGGTFTDAVLVAEGRLHTAKVPTTPDDQSEGVMAAVEQALERAGAAPEAVTRFVHGMTVATNALLEERGARTALLATEGFTDVIEIARQNRPHLYRLCSARPPPLVPSELRFSVRGRLGPGGAELMPLDEDRLAETLDRLVEAGVEAIAIALLHSYADPRHEQQVARAVSERVPGVHVSASHEVLSVFREYERTSTTVVDAYLSPLLRDYLGRLVEGSASVGLTEPEVMGSSGGVMTATEAGRHAARTLLSGPAGGAVGAALAGAEVGAPDVLSFDMGGTSCDVAVVDDGRVRQTAERTIAGRALQLPMVDVHTVGAGGGSIAWLDAGGALRVGPRSAGARPGPACYGLGGVEPTVTDANLVLGYLAADSLLAGGVRLDGAAARVAVGDLANHAGLDLEEAAWGIAQVADAEMLRALRVVTVERGIDPRSYAMVAFGGAGPMHAARIAEELGIRRVLCPPAAGVLSALGLAVADRRRDVAQSVLLAGEDLTEARVQAVVDRLAAEAARGMDGSHIEVGLDLRYRGQAFELSLEEVDRPEPGVLRERFDAAHHERYGYRDPDSDLELVTVRVAAVAAGAVAYPKPYPNAGAIAAPGGGTAARGEREAVFAGGSVRASVLCGEPQAGERLDGPALLEQPDTTVVVPPGWSATTLPDRTVSLERST